MSPTRRSGDKVRFAIMATPRTGSTFLAHLLGTHVNIFSYREIFHRTNLLLDPSILPGFPDLPALMAYRNRHPFRFLEGLFGLRPERAVGFKLMPGQSAGVQARVLNGRDFRIIRIGRMDLIRAYCSFRRAVKTNEWVSGATEASSGSPVLIGFKPAKFDAFVKASRWLDRRISRVRPESRALSVTYEGLFGGNDAERVAEFLGEEPDFDYSAVPLRRQSGGEPLRSLVGNYGEMASYVERRHPELARFLDA